MKFIDDKGRLFGKINIIDAAIIILLTAIVIIYAGLIKKTTSIDDFYKIKSVVVKVYVKSAPIKILKIAKIGDQSIDTKVGFHGVLEKITDRKKEENLSDESMEITDLIVELRLNVYKVGDLLLYKKSPIKLGRWVNFETDNYRLQGEILEIIKGNEQE